MKYQFEILKKTGKNQILPWLLIFVALIFFYFLLLYFDARPITEIDFFSAIGINFPKISSTGFLLLLYQTGLTVYFTTTFFQYENKNSPEYIMCREKSNRWFKKKVFTLIGSLLLFRSLYYVLISCILNNINVSFFYWFILSILYHSFISFSTIFIINHKKCVPIIVIVFFILLFPQLQLFLYLLGSIILYVINALNFKYKNLF